MSTSSAKRTLRWRPVGDTLLLVEEAEARYDGPLASNVAACALAACGLGSGGAMRSSGLQRCVFVVRRMIRSVASGVTLSVVVCRNEFFQDDCLIAV